jgi:hypothetical protein
MLHRYACSRLRRTERCLSGLSRKPFLLVLMNVEQ